MPATTERSDHCVQLFDAMESRAEAVARHLGAALRAGGSALALVRAETWSESRERLAREVDAETLGAAGRLVVQDAAALADAVIEQQIPGTELFEKRIARSVRLLARRQPLHVYGEVVDVLVSQGELEGALGLEALWNRLARDVPLSLLCGYSAACFVGPSSPEGLRRVCRAHLGARADPDDLLGAWLLERAGVAASGV